MTLVRTHAGRRVELVNCSDPYTGLGAGARGTYEWANESDAVMFPTQHSIKWDSGSNLMLIQGQDSFRFLTEDEVREEAKASA